MNILYINHYAGSPRMGMEFRPYYFAREWVKMGHDVTMIAGDYSHLRSKNPDVLRDFQESNIDGIRYVWLKTGQYEGNGVKRAMTMKRFVSKLYMSAGKIADRFSPDVVISSSTYPLDTYPARRIAKKAGAKLIHEAHDMWPSTLTEIGGMSKYHPFVIAMQFAENAAYKNSERVVSLGPLTEPYMREHGLAPNKFIHIPNGVDYEEWRNPEPLPGKMEKRLKEIRANGEFIVGYFGGHALSNNLRELIEVATRLKERKIHFVLVGNGVEKKSLIELADERGLSNIDFFGPVPKKAIPTLVKFFDCGYVGAKASPLYRFGICVNKVFDYMAGGLPIICAITVPSSQVSEAGCGICVDSGSTDAVVDAVIEMSDNSPEKMKELGERGKKAVREKYRYDILAKQFSELFE